MDSQIKLKKNLFIYIIMTIVIPELYIKKIIIEHYLTIIIIKSRVFIKIKLIISINISYIPTESRKDIMIKNA
jgi:hypothetical protein